jgi:hypothetical protein
MSELLRQKVNTLYLCVDWYKYLPTQIVLNRIRNVSQCTTNEHISMRSTDSTASRSAHHQIKLTIG